MTIWFASGNVNKKKELATILSPYNVLIPADAGLDFDPEETGATFYENALLKARTLYTLLQQGPLLLQGRPPLYSSGDPIIADDSGLCVDALSGRPGIFSARYAGQPKEAHTGHTEITENLNFISSVPSVRGIKKSSTHKLESHERNVLLLGEMDGKAQRTARFVCAMALLFTPDRFFVVQETLEGEIVKNLQTARGTGGFGYDPILYIPGMGRTVAELSDDEKNTISHRAKAGKIIAAIVKACS